MKKAFFLALCVLGVSSSAWAEKVTLMGRPATYSNGMVSCGTKPGICAVIETNNRTATVHVEGGPTFKADAAFTTAKVGEGVTMYYFTNVSF